MTMKRVKAARPGAATRGRTVRAGKGFSVVRPEAGQRQKGKYPVQTVATRWKDAESGQWTSPPAGEQPTRKRAAGGVILTRRRDDHGDVTGARVIHGDARRAQRAGKMKKAQVRELEKDLSRDYLEAVNPAAAEALHLERMHEAHRSSKAKRAAVTRKKAPAKKHRAPDLIRRDLLRTEELVRDAQRRHSGAKSQKGKQQAADQLRARRARLGKLRQELTKAQKAAK